MVRRGGSMDERSAAEFADTNCILSLVDIIVRHPKVRVVSIASQHFVAAAVTCGWRCAGSAATA